MNESADAAEQGQAPTPEGKRKSSLDRWVKLGFLVAFLVVIGIVTYFQLRGPVLGWPGDLDEALATAKRESRRLVVYVRSFPVSATGRRMVLGMLRKKENQDALTQGNYVLAEIVLDRSAGWARKYGVTRAPTMLVVSPDGEKFHKQEGFIGELDFRNVFLKTPLR